MKLPERKTNGELPAFTDWWGYPIIYLDIQDNVLCPDCANDLDKEREDWPDFAPVAFDVMYEGLDYCTECSKLLFGAYEDESEYD
jgi:hypothetical protein